jgi:GDP-L-fucose synthase
MGRKETVLVTGGSGLVGRCLADELQDGAAGGAHDRGFIFLSSKDGDLTEFATTKRIFEQHRPDHVIHLAAKVGGLYANMNNKSGQFYEINAKLNENVLASSFEFGVKRCISCLSTCIFPDQVEYPLDESKVSDNDGRRHC